MAAIPVPCPRSLGGSETFQMCPGAHTEVGTFTVGKGVEVKMSCPSWRPEDAPVKALWGR